MSEFVKHATLAKAMQAVMSEVAYVQKKTRVENKYTAAGESEVIAAIRPAMVRNGVIGPIPVGCPTLKVEDSQTSTGKATRHCVVLREFRFQHADSDEFYVVCVPGEANDSGDKSVAKALTIAKKYALREAFCLETGDDPDFLASERGAENEPDFRRVATAIESAGNLEALAKAEAGLTRYRDAFDAEQFEKLRLAADRKRRSFPGQPPRAVEPK